MAIVTIDFWKGDEKIESAIMVSDFNLLNKFVDI